MSDILTVNYEKKPCYDIVIDNSFSELVQRVKELGFENRKIAIITDSNVEPLYGDEIKNLLASIANKAIVYAIPAGEENKNLSEIEKIYQVLIDEHFDRHDLIVALGGGVVGDMAGFTAATYLRGISFIQIPTTLLAQTDSSIGGKTGVDYKGFKNMVGAFHMPRLVYINISTLNSLDYRQFASGFAEVMKHGLIKDSNFYTFLIDNIYEIGDKDPDDPTEKGDRVLLNFGHTLGHAIEKAKNFELLHGECVALGCICAAFISWKKEMISMEEYYEIRDMFVPFNLPISIEDLDSAQVIELAKSDKKADLDKIRFILLKSIGKAVVSMEVTDDEMKKALEEIIYIENND